MQDLYINVAAEHSADAEANSTDGNTAGHRPLSTSAGTPFSPRSHSAAKTLEDISAKLQRAQKRREVGKRAACSGYQAVDGYGCPSKPKAEPAGAFWKLDVSLAPIPARLHLRLGRCICFHCLLTGLQWLGALL